MKKWIARRILTLAGWKIEGYKPQHNRFVLIAAPHTSNWDFPLMLLFAAAFDVKINWLAKHNLFYPPIGWVMRAMGGIPITRHRSGNVVSALVDAFAAHEHLALAVPTEGTRTRSDYWKSGFYHIASGAGVPIIPSYLDYGARRGGFGPALELTGNLVADMDTLRSFYAPMQGKFPEQFGPVRLREEQGS